MKAFGKAASKTAEAQNRPPFMSLKKRSKVSRPRDAKPRSRVVAGWREYVVLPALGIGPLVAKLDTGARTAALHAENISIYEKDGHYRIRFDVPVDSRSRRVKTCDLVLSDERRVKNTGGRSELRQVVETDVDLGGTIWQAQITLTNRTDMGVPMLLGRNTIKERFVVHPGRSFVLSKQNGGDG
jgi:hypothetical protein